MAKIQDGTVVQTGTAAYCPLNCRIMLAWMSSLDNEGPTPVLWKYSARRKAKSPAVMPAGFSLPLQLGAIMSRMLGSASQWSGDWTTDRVAMAA